MNKVSQQFIEAAGADRVKVQEPMKQHTTFRIGGPADYFLTPESIEEVQKLIQICDQQQIPYFILGNGSNLLVSDAGYPGAVIQLYRNFSAITVEENQMRVQAGALLSQIASQALAAGLTGLEFAAGIPGTLGGAVVMNAGAYGGEMKQVLKEVTVLTPQGEVLVLKAENLELGYRTSVVKTKNYIVIEAVLQLEEGETAGIKEKMDELRRMRIEKQPLEYPSAGSTFKRPEGYFAGKLIMDAGLRGYTVGGACVSEKHCGFVINRGNASAADVMELIRDVQRIVYEKYQIKLETEVKILGEI
ncbi:MAG: UDP-N-acetylmuramate dehydrogenase [Lachnospiraceae bacterium]|nr:UDP-N-acetylmuramate dehydrogenase [Lachnospiraceae bacterium]